MRHRNAVPPVAKSSFAPVVDAATRLLVLGSLTGDRSLAEGRYYAHPQNQFWRLIGGAIGRDVAAMDYDDRLAVLRAAHVGLWDVIASAHRPGSSDAAIRDHRANDLVALVAALPDLRAIAFNGATSARIGGGILEGRFPAVVRIPLPSSSALHTIGVSRKAASWNILGIWIE